MDGNVEEDENDGAILSQNFQVIWSVTTNCPFECKQCAVNANQKSRRLSVSTLVEIAQNLRQLNNASFDLSGGDCLYTDHDFQTTKKVAKILGRERCSISTTGARLGMSRLAFLSGIAGVDFTLDEAPGFQLGVRPKGYLNAAIKGIEACQKEHIPISVFTVLSHWTSSPQNLSGIQTFLDQNGIEQWVWLPLYPIGRAALMESLAYLYPDPEKLKDTLPGLVVPKLQHTLTAPAECHAKTQTLYVSSSGFLCACPWALLPNGNPRPDFVLGDLLRESVGEILERPWTTPDCPAPRRIAWAATA